MLELVAGVLLAAGLVFFVLRPVLRPTTGLEAGEAEEAGADEGDDPDDDFSPQAVALRALKEIEFDRATGKLSDGDYETLKAKYTAEALTALRAEHPGSEMRDAGGMASGAVSHPASRIPHPACATHGPRPESDA